jgi:hypothetical protein
MHPALRQLSALAVIALSAASTIACAGNAEPADKSGVAATELSDGLTVVDADAAMGKLVLAFKHDGRAVTFHLRLGPKMQSGMTPEELERTDIVNHEIDGIVFDQEGRAMTTQIGGDRFIDPTWKMMDSSKGIDLEVRTADLARAVAAREALASWTAPAGLEQLRLGAMQLSHLSKNIDADQAPKVSAEVGPALGTKWDTVNPSGEAYANYDWSYSMWQKSTLVIAEHSAVRLNLWSAGGTAIRSWSTCNHGACAASEPMSRNCLSVRMGDSNDTRYVYGESSESPGSGRAGCTTAYWPQGDAFGNGHNCHNDSRLQRYAIVTGSVGDASRAGNYGTLCAKEDIRAPDTCPTSF